MAARNKGVAPRCNIHALRRSYTPFNGLDWLALALVIIGAVNWGLVGLGILVDADLNLVDLLLGWSPTLEALVYLLVGLAGLYLIYLAYQLANADT